MRAFISIDFPEEIVNEIIKIQEFLPEFDGKKTEVDNLHLTLKFLGEIDKDFLKNVKTALSKVNFLKLHLKLGEVGVFSENFIRIVWIEILGCDNLQKEIDSSLVNLFEKEKRFMGHLTLARVKKIDNKKNFIDELKKIPIPNLSFEVNNFNLKKSVLTKKGAIYSNIEAYSLKN
jgi:2'-5' RNA ligase